jgi:hypothetical protein
VNTLPTLPFRRLVPDGVAMLMTMPSASGAAASTPAVLIWMSASASELSPRNCPGQF